MAGKGNALLSMSDKVDHLKTVINKKAEERDKYAQHLRDRREDLSEKDKKEMETTIKVMEMDIEELMNVVRGLEEDLDQAKQEDEDEEEEEEDDEDEMEAFRDASEKNASGSTKKMKKRYSRAEVEQMLRKEREERRVSVLESRMDRLITAIHDTSGRGRRASGSSPPRAPPPTERRRTLGTAPSFTTGETDFMIFAESFMDYCSLNDITEENKRKRLFLMSLDQTARMRCAGLSPDEPPCLGMTAEEYIGKIKELFVPRATMLVVQQAFHELKQQPAELPVDFLMNKFARFRRGWSAPSAPFSFFYEAATAGLYDEQLRKEVYRKIITCDDSNNRIEVNKAFQEFVEHVQVCVGYLRRTAQGNPDMRGLAVAGQSSKPVKASQLAETAHWETMEEVESDYGDYEEEVHDLDEQEIAFVEAMEDQKFTDLIEADAQTIEETGAVKLCFLCKSPSHLARNCRMRLNNLSGAMEKMGFVPRGGARTRGMRRGRGSWGAGRTQVRGRGRTPPLAGTPMTLPPSGPLSMRPMTSTHPPPFRGGNF